MNRPIFLPDELQGQVLMFLQFGVNTGVIRLRQSTPAWSGHIAVMYLGRVVEYGPTPTIINAPQHPYTRALLGAIPEPDPDLTRNRERIRLRGVDIASLLHVPSGCSFHPRCPLFEQVLCDVVRPELVQLDERQSAACHVVAREHAVALAV